MAERVAVRAVWDEGPLLSGVRLGALPRYRPGQAVKVMHAGSSAFFALATAWGNDRAPELLLRRGGGVADALLRDVHAGDTIALEGPLGPGFALDVARGKDILLAAAGSAISAIRTVVETICDERAAYGRVTLFYGQERANEFAYAAARAAWARAGVDVVLCAHADPAFTGEHGFVQDVIVERGLHCDGAGLVAYVCGMQGMISGVREALLSLGVAAENVLSNT